MLQFLIMNAEQLIPIYHTFFSLWKTFSVLAKLESQQGTYKLALLSSRTFEY